MKSILIYMHDIRKSVKLSSKDEIALASRIQSGDRKALEILVKANLKFVVKVCQNYRNQGLPMADLINEGNLGLIRAAKRFDGQKGIRFISYAVWWIRQGILDALARQSRSLNLPAGLGMDIQKINKASKILMQRLNRQPTMEEIGSETKLNPENLKRCMEFSEPFLSLNSKPNGEDGSELQDSLIDKYEAGSEELLDVKMRKGFLSRLMLKLNARDRQIIRLYYGLDTGVSSSLGEIASRFGVSRERTRQIMKNGMEQLKRLIILPMNYREINGHAPSPS